jgi:hypothetical protein
MPGDSFVDSGLGGAAANAGCSEQMGTKPVQYPANCRCGRLAAVAVLSLLTLALPRAAEALPPVGLYGRPVAQPYFDFPSWARFSNCRPWPLAWGYDPFPNYGPVDCQGLDVPTVSCIGDFVAHRPSLWYASADFAPLTIDYRNNVEIARIDPTGPTALSTRNLRPEFDAGGKFTLGARIFDCYRLEGTYWGNYQWDDQAAVFGEGDLSLLLSGFADPEDPGIDQNDFVSIAGASRMNSAETNLRYWVDMPPGPFDVSLLVGGRYLRIDDRFGLLASNVGGDIGLDVRALNELYCLQIGIAGDFLIHPRVWFNVDLKGAICHNDIGVTSAFSGAEVLEAGIDRERTAWLGDISLSFNLQVLPWMAARIGYQALFVEGLALAAQNIETSGGLVLDDPARLDDRGRLVYHGPFIGLMGVW